MSVGVSVECGRVVDPPPSWWSGAAPLRLIGSCSQFFLRRKNLCRRFFRARLPIWGPVRVPVGMSPPSRIPSSIMFRCLRRRRPGSRATCNRCGVYAHVWWLITRVSSGCAVRCFRCLLRWRVLVALIKETGVFVRLRLRLRRDARHRRPPPTPATDARHQRPREAKTRAGTRGRCPGSFPNSPQNTHGKPRSFLRQNVAVRRFGAFLLHLLCLTSTRFF